MGLLPAHQVDVAQLPALVLRQRRGPDQAGGAVAEQVGRDDRGEIVDGRELAEPARVAPPVAGLVEVEPDAVPAEVDQVGGAGAVDVGDPQPPLVELVRLVEHGRVRHGDLGAEAAVAEIRPVADLAVADPDQVVEPVAGHVGEVDLLDAVRIDQAWTVLLVARLVARAGPRRSRPRPGRGTR